MAKTAEELKAVLSAQELLALLEAGNLYGLMLRVNQAWIDQDHPDASHGAIYVYHHDDTPPVRITIPVSASSSSLIVQ